MSIKVRIPHILRHCTDRVEMVEVNGTTVGACLQQLIKAFPRLERVLFSESRDLDVLVNVFINNELLSADNDALATAVGDEDEISFVILMADG